MSHQHLALALLLTPGPASSIIDYARTRTWDQQSSIMIAAIVAEIKGWQ
jgi:hypothetical protein